MNSISKSVGKDCVNNSADVRIVQELLNNCSYRPPVPLNVDGNVSTQFISAIEAFQRYAMGLVHPDGKVDPDGKTFKALLHGPEKLAYALPEPNPNVPKLSEEDFKHAAKMLNCEVACIKAVTEVESAGSGFFASGNPKILYEAHKFSKLTQHKYDSSNPDISSLKWNKALYAGGEKEFNRLKKAIAIDAHAAIQSASWGRFQIMGENYKMCGHTSPESFVEAMYETEGKHLEAFVGFVKSAKLDSALRNKNWAAFARGYNGEGYAQNHYDTKLAAAYKKHSA
jgi:hypothetical protein